MDPPLAALAATATATVTATAAAAAAVNPHQGGGGGGGGYPESLESSPRSRHTDSWDEALPQVPGAKLRLMCSYGGHIFPRPHDKVLCYLGGDTRIVVVERHTSLADLSLRLSRTVLNGRPFILKYQLPNEDLDSLVSVTTDEDLENMIEEYDRTSKSSRLRLFLFPTKVETASSLGTLIEDSAKSESWFVDALNGASAYLPRGVSADAASVNCLLGLEVDDVGGGKCSGDGNGDGENIGEEQQKRGASKNSNQQDVHSMPDSPMLETTSSFGSTSSSPSMANLPPIRVHVEDHPKVGGGLEESFAQMSVSAAATATATATGGVPFLGGGVVASDDERSDPAGYRKPPSPQMPSQDDMSRDNGIPNPVSRAKPVVYQEVVQRVAAVDPKSRDGSDPNYRTQMQLQDAGYLMPSHSQLDQHQQHQQQQQQQFQQQQHQQFLHAGTHYIQHTTGGPGGGGAYYAMQPQPQQHQHQHQLDPQHHYPMYLMPLRHTQPYNASIQSNLSESSRPPLPPNPTILTSSAYKDQPLPSLYPSRAPTPPKPEMGASLYRTAASPPPQIVHMTAADQHYANYSHQPPQSITSAAANYTYEFTDPAHSQIYYTQPIAASLPPQYQTITSAAAIPGSEMPTDATKQQHQIRTSQPI